MATSAVKVQRIGPFPLGMDNRVPDFKLKLPKDAGHLLRDALNVDVTAQGTVKTRAGFALTRAGLDCHSLWSPLSGSYALYCDEGTIYRVDASMTPIAVATGFGRMTPVRYAEVNEAIYFSDSVRSGSYHPVAGPTPQWFNVAPVEIGEQRLSAMPAGSQIAYHGGRLLVAVGAVLVYSEPFMPHLRDEARGYELFPAPITCLAAVEGGVFVVADQTYFLAGGLPAQSVRAMLSYGAPEQQAGYRTDGGAHWMSHQGVVSCSRSGEISNLQDAHVALAAEGAAATLWRQADGMQAIVAALSEPSNTGAGVGSYAQARIVRKDSQ